MLDLYRRHTPKCPHRAKGQGWTKCSCPIWCDGRFNGKRVRRSMGLRDWARAGRRLDKWESAPETATAERPIADAIESYLGDCRARKLAKSTVRSYNNTLSQLQVFCDGADVHHVDDLDLGVLTDFRASRPVEATTSAKELNALRIFCGFAVKRKWLPQNYAKQLSQPKEARAPTLPFAHDEVERILDACDRIEDGNPNTQARTRARARALVLTMLYSGLRISDTVKLRRDAVDLTSGKMLLRIMKTGAPLYVRLGKPAIRALEGLPHEGEYFFWSGESKLASAVGTARKTIARVLIVAGIEGHPHRFRDTFSVSLLEKGEDLRTVQLLLGHTSIKTTEKHYAPFVQSFQRILDGATAKLAFGQGQGEGVVHKLVQSGKDGPKLLKTG